MRFNELVIFWNRSKTGHAKSVKFTELDMDYMISVKGYYIQYLPLLQKDLDSRDEQQTSG